MAEKRELSEVLEKIGNEVLNENQELNYIKNSAARVVYLTSNLDKKKGKDGIVYGQCEKIPGRYKWGIRADFAITVFTGNVEHFTRDQMKILIFHELLHIGIEKQPDGEEVYYINNHDLEDFKLIIDRYGTDWANTQPSLFE